MVLKHGKFTTYKIEQMNEQKVKINVEFTTAFQKRYNNYIQRKSTFYSIVEENVIFLSF